MREYLEWDRQAFMMLSPEEKFDMFYSLAKDYEACLKRLEQIDDIVGVLTERGSREDNR